MSASFKQFLKEYANKDKDRREDDDPATYPYIISHNPTNKTSWMYMGIEGGGPMTYIELINSVRAQAKTSPVSFGHMTLSRAAQISDAYKTDPELARHMLSKHIEEHHDGDKVTKMAGLSPDDHPHFDTMLRMHPPGAVFKE